MISRDDLVVLQNRCKLALGSMALVDKQLLCICTALDNELGISYDEPIRGEEEKSDDFFLSPFLSVYDEAE